jgi:polyisoprenoid-binding protein YceI
MLVTMLGLAVAGLLAPSFARAEALTYKVDNVHSAVGFKIRHLVAKTNGEFGDYSGTVTMDPENIAKTLKLNATIQATSVDTDNDKRDNHLRSEDFFAVEENPEITFVSKSVVKEAENKFAVTGDLTMRGVTKEVTLMAEVLGTMINPMAGTPMVGMDIGGTVNRQDFGISWNRALDQGGVILGDDVEIDVHLEANVPKVEEAEAKS